MRGTRLAAITLALATCGFTLSVCYAQTPDEQPGQSLPIQTNVGSYGYNCGRVSSPMYCYGIPVLVNGQPGGSFWLDTYLSGSNAGHGFIMWSNVGDLAEATIVGTTFVGSSNMPSSVTVNFSGDTNDGDGGSYVGSMTLNFTYYYSAGGGGRGGAGSGYRYICTGGTVNVTYK